LLWGASRVVDGGVQWRLFEQGCDAHASSDNPGGHDDPGGRPGHGSTLRSSLSGLLPEVGGERLHRHRLQLYIIGSVQDDGVGTLSYVLRQPILAASTSGIAGRRPSATRPRLLGHGCDTAGSSSRAEVIDLIVIYRLGAHAALARPARASSAASGARGSAWAGAALLTAKIPSSARIGWDQRALRLSPLRQSAPLQLPPLHSRRQRRGCWSVAQRSACNPLR
jgi:hypothetical protein